MKFRKPYHDKWVEVTWETCALRNWLNNTFYTGVFSSSERDRIIKTTVYADPNPTEYSDSGNATEDKIFILSIAEANYYFAGNLERMSEVTQYAARQGYVFNDGQTVDFGDNTGVTVRPVMWISID